MEAIVTGATANSSAEAAEGIFQKAKRHIRYVIIYKENVKKFEEKLKTLMAKRTSVQQEVDVAERNLDKIKADVQHWCETVDEKIEEEEKKVKDLEEKAKNKCFFTLCPNIKSRYQLSRKAEEGATAFDGLLQQGEFNSVSCPAPPPDIVDATPKDFEAFESRKKVFNDVMEALKKATIKVIGVYGMGGMGKTTLVNEVARQVKEDKLFDKVVMAVITPKPDISKIQDLLAELLGLKLEERSEEVRAVRLRERLKKEKKVLIILDDIWKKLDLNKVGIPFGDENKECKILLTSRVLNVLRNEMDAQEYFAVDVLEDEEAWNLFKKMAGDDVESHELKSTAFEVAKKCAGLPLAIKTVARALRNKDLSAWEDALRQLPAKDVDSAIMLSYNHLESGELKQTFLLCSLLRRNTSIEDLLKCAIGLGLMAGVNTVKGARNRLLTMVSQLKESCLLLDDYKSFGNIEYFDMHDLVYDVAMSTASEDSRMFRPKDDDDLQNWLDGKEMKCWNKIYLRDTSICKLPDGLNCPHLDLLMFGKHFGKHLSLEMSTNFFKETTNLKVLNLSMMQFSSLPSSIRLLTSLCTLCLDGCELGEVAIIGELKNLEILSLQNSDIKSLPKEIGRLLKLKLLDLTWCRKLKIIPPGIFSGLSRLEELYMGGTFVEWEVGGPTNQQSNASLAELLTLSRLTTLNVDILDANATPWDLFFEKLQKLEKYKILIGTSQTEWFYEYEYSRTLILKLSTSIVHLNQGIKLKKTEDMRFCELKGVKIALQKLKGEESFWHLKKLCIEHGSEIKYIINDVAGEFPHLRSLRLEDLPQLISFCSEEKNGSTSIPQHELPLFNEKVSFPCLEELHLSWINVERMWHNQPSNESFCTHPNLTSLVIMDCDNLKQLFSSSVAKGLVHLKDLKITGCKLLREIIFMEDEDIEEENKAAISFPQLNTLKINNCPELKGFIFNAATDTKKSFFRDKVLCPNLETLHVGGCDNLEYMFPSSLIKHFKQLLELGIYGCKNMEEVILVDGLAEAKSEAEGEGMTTQMSFPKLEKLDLSYLPKPVRFCHEGDNSKSDALALFDEKVSFPCLEKLHLSSINVERIWHNQPSNGSFCTYHPAKLTSLIIKDCGNLKHLLSSSMARRLVHLKDFEIRGCKLLREIIFTEDEDIDAISFPQLNTLRVEDCTELKGFIFNSATDTRKSFFSDKVSFPCLEKLHLSSINVERIWHNQPSNGSFCTYHPAKLTSLIIKDCGNLKHLLSSSMARRLVHLKDFEIRGCKLLREIIFTEDEDIDAISFPQLNTLRVKDCMELKGFIFNSATDTKKSFFSDKVSFPCLKKLHLSKINVERISHNQPSNGSSCTHPNLTSLKITDCDNIKQLFSSSVARGLMHLKYFEISRCKFLREIIFTEDEDIEEENRTTISFSQLNTLMINDCPELKGFIFNSATDTKKSFFSDKVSFPCLEKLHLSKINVERISHNQPSNGSSCTHPNLTSLKITDCDNLKQLFSSSVARGLMHLKYFEISRCKLLREIIFTEDEDIEEENRTTISFSQLNTLMINDCLELKGFIFNSAMDTKKSFFSDKVLCPNLQTLNVRDCHNLKYMFPSSLIKHFKQLLELTLYDCENMEEVILVDGLAEAKSEAEGEGMTTQMSFPILEKLNLKSLPKLVRFCHEGDNSKSDALALFDEKVAFPCLRELTIEGMGMWSKIWHHKVAMERLEKLEWLWIWDCESLEEIIEFPEHGFNSKLPNLKWLWVKGFNKVKAKILGGEYLNFGETQPLFWVSDQETFSNLVPSFVSFRNLTRLIVSKCHGFINLVTLTVAKSMVQLEYMAIEDCQMMEEIVASSTSDEVMDVIVFSKLKTLKLVELPSLSSFCSRNCTFEFPSLGELVMIQCPKTEIFTKGELNTPMLQSIKTEYGGNYVWHYEGNLNATVKQLFIEQDVQNSKEEKEDDDD